MKRCWRGIIVLSLVLVFAASRPGVNSLIHAQDGLRRPHVGKKFPDRLPPYGSALAGNLILTVAGAEACLSGISKVLGMNQVNSTPTELTGAEIMERVVHRPSWDDMTSDITLTLVSARGEERVRKLKSYSKKYSEDESMMLMRFLEPVDVRGTGFLIIEHQDADDDRYVYLPALRRVNRIAASGRGGNFMSSDFTYYDIGKPKLADWVCTRLPDEEVDETPCYKVECIAASRQVIKETGYSKVVRWIHKENFLTMKAVYFDNRGREWKQLEVPQIQNIEGIWFATKMIMRDLQSRHESVLVFQNILVNQHLSDAMFSQRYLARWP